MSDEKDILIQKIKESATIGSVQGEECLFVDLQNVLRWRDACQPLYPLAGKDESNAKSTTECPKIVTNLLDSISLSKDSYIELTGRELLGTLLVSAMKLANPSSTLTELRLLTEKNASFFNSEAPLKIYTTTQVTEMTTQDLRAHLLLDSTRNQGFCTMEHTRKLLDEQKAYFDSGEIIHIYQRK
jgi:hypothetical protein